YRYLSLRRPILDLLSLYGYPDHLDLPSFPTRRSSDLSASRSARRRRSQRGAHCPCRPSERAPRAHLPEQAAQHLATMRVDELIRSEEHTSELQSRENLVCRLLLEKKKKTMYHSRHYLE